MASRLATAVTDHRRALVRAIADLGQRNGHGAWRIFTDFCELAAIAVSNAVDVAQFDAREAMYLQAVKRYQPEEAGAFPKMFGHLIEALEAEVGDVLGSVFHELELHNKWAGQFFSPYPLCRMMAAMTVGESDVQEKIAERGYLAALEPACGSGAMAIALAEELRAAKVNYQQALHVTAVDIDIKCVHMAYLQLSLLHVPAVVVHGNSLTLEQHSHWYTPAHIVGGWRWKLARGAGARRAAETAAGPPAPVAVERVPALAGTPTQLTLF